MTLIAPQPVAVTGTAVTYAAAGASDTFAPNPRGVLLYKTAGTGTTVTVVVPGNDERGQAKPDVAVTLSATQEKGIPTAAFVSVADADGLVTVTTSAQTNVTVAYVII